MADYFDQQPNFTNPSYATPEQLAAQRAYADALMKRSGGDVTRPTGAIANMIDALTANLQRNNANQIQSQAAQGNANDVSALVSQLQNGQQLDPQTLGRLYANPMASPEARALVDHLIGQKPVEDVYGRPGYASPATGVHAPQISGPFQPGYRAPESAGGVGTTTAFPAPGVAPTGPPMPAASSAPIPSTPKVWGDREAQAAGLYPPSQPVSQPTGSGGQVSPGRPPPQAAPAATGSRIDQLAEKDRELSAEKNRTEGGSKAEAGVIETDVKRAAAAPETLKGLGIMKNTIQSVGDKMTFGPTAKMSNEARRVISNYAPGLVDEKALAGADAIEKLNLGLAGSLSQQLGLNPSDIYRSVASVPGNEKSKAGTLALINMMEQAARNDQYVGTTLYQNSKGNLGAYQLARAAYYEHHPIINPITGNPVEIDAKSASQSGASYEKTATNPTTGEKIGLRNGKWEPIK